jgi:alkanesulfonate monooxygenase SsuD/methylene tetrahydromethanopterin reductase-like flavin-dependent oxidoreductase (luciferase family)
MRIGLHQEGQNPPELPVPEHEFFDRYHELVAEAQAAEEWGFDFYGVGEQHFASSNSRVSSPLPIHSFIAALTSTIRLRPMSLNLLPYNHPIRIAEQVATLDVLSKGRAELGGARSNNLITLEGFGVDPTMTRMYRDESLRVIAAALTSDPFEYHGEIYDIPSRNLAPQPVQTPHPPLFIAATGTDSNRAAGHMGIGTMIGFTISWELTEACIRAYQEGFKEVEPITGHPNYSIGIFSTAVNCAPTRAAALETAGPVAVRWMEIVKGMYDRLNPTSPDYAYLAAIGSIADHFDDPEYLARSMPYILFGTPDDLIEHAVRLHSLGATELILRIDGLGHEHNMAAIEMIGRHVLPTVHNLT